MGLSISLLGGFSIAFARQPIIIRNRKARTLLAYVALNPTFNQTREQLAGLLWSEFPEAHARASLRQALRGLRQTFDNAGAVGLIVGRDEIALSVNPMDVDVLAVLESARSGDLHPSLLDHRDLPRMLLAGFDDVDPSVYSWLVVQRQHMLERLVFALETRLGSEEPLDNTGLRAAKSFALALFNLDPTHEGATRRLMTIAAVEGDVPGAIRRYQQLWELLDREHGMEPSDETQELAAQIKLGTLLGASARPVADHNASASTRSLECNEVAPRLRLVINAFEHDALAPSRHYLVSGFRMQLIAALVRFREWSVIDGSRIETAPISEEPAQTDYYFDATSYEIEDNIQLVVTLRDPTTGAFVWSDDYSMDLSEWFATQRTIVRKIAIALNVQVSAARIAGVVEEPDVSIPVYDRWLWGQNLSKWWRAEPETRSARVFRKIIEDAPEFVPAYCSLVNYSNSRHLIYPGVFRCPEEERRTLELAKTAIRIDPLVPGAQLCSAWSHALNRQFDQAEFRYQLAYDLNPNDPWTMISSALGLAFCGQYDTARERAAQAIKLGLNVERLHWGYQAVIQFVCGDYRASEIAAERAEDAIYNFLAWRSAALAHLGLRSDAEAELARFMLLVKDDWSGETPPDDGSVARWLLHAFPIRNLADWERLRDGLRMAGGPAFDVESDQCWTH